MPASTLKPGLFPRLVEPLVVILGSLVLVVSERSTRPMLVVLFLGCLLSLVGCFVLKLVLMKFARPRPRRCPECGAKDMWLLVQATPIASCRKCGRHFKRIGLSWREVELEMPPRWWLADRRRAFRAYDARPLPLSALDPVIDRSTCGRLLGAKRSSDPRDLITRESPQPPSGKPEPAPGMLTTFDRLLWRKRRVQGSMPAGEAADGGVWDPWLDG